MSLVAIALLSIVLHEAVHAFNCFFTGGSVSFGSFLAGCEGYSGLLSMPAVFCTICSKGFASDYWIRELPALIVQFVFIGIGTFFLFKWVLS